MTQQRSVKMGKCSDVQWVWNVAVSASALVNNLSKYSWKGTRIAFSRQQFGYLFFSDIYAANTSYLSDSIWCVQFVLLMVLYKIFATGC